MQENLSMFLHGAAASLRDLALRAPEIANELRRFADELEEAAERAAGTGYPSRKTRGGRLTGRS